MQILIDVILPVFFVIGAGYLVRRLGWFADSAVDGLMQFGQSFALPLLLFRAASTLDLGQSFDGPVLISFFAGALAGFFSALFLSHYVFKRDWPDAVVFGFTGMFSNSLLLGLSITERAYGPEALTSNYAIIALHSPIL